MTAATTNEIPGPKPHALIGNVLDLDIHAPVQSMLKLAHEYGPIFRLYSPKGETIVVNSQELVNELCDEKRFDKKLHGFILQARDSSGDGLFTAATNEPNWGLAHRILTPAFGPASLKNLFPSMWDILEQMLLKWERQGESERIDVADNMSRLTLDTLALCAFSYRFNSFYHEEMHPYVKNMLRVLQESGARAQRPALIEPADVFQSSAACGSYSQQSSDRGRIDRPAEEAGKSARLQGPAGADARGQGPSDRSRPQR